MVLIREVSLIPYCWINKSKKVVCTSVVEMCQLGIVRMIILLWTMW